VLQASRGEKVTSNQAVRAGFMGGCSVGRTFPMEGLSKTTGTVERAGHLQGLQRDKVKGQLPGGEDL
jgi:hypothetical protein